MERAYPMAAIAVRRFAATVAAKRRRSHGVLASVGSSVTADAAAAAVAAARRDAARARRCTARRDDAERTLPWDLCAVLNAAPNLARPLLFLRVLTLTTDPQTPTMTTNDEFYREQKWCAQCKTYVRFLMSVNHSFCVQCGGRVRLFSSDDDRGFTDTVQRHKWQAS